MKENTYKTIESLYVMLLSKHTTRMQPTLVPVIHAYEALSHYIVTCGLSQPRYIHILGTNGKGSTSVYITNLAYKHGVNVGLFTSPHIVSITERILVNGEMCTEGEWLEAASILEHICDTCELLFFEYIFLLSIYIFSSKKVEIAVMEAGLGGKYDATSILPHCIQCFTPIALDHEHILGRTYHAIAEQKAGAIQKDSIVLSAPQKEEVKDVLCKAASQGVIFSSNTIKYKLLLQGKHQSINASLAYLAWTHMCHLFSIDCVESYVEDAYKESYFPGRMEEIILPGDIRLLLDGAHNCAGLEVLYQYCEAREIKAVFYSTVYRESIQETVTWIHKIAKGVPIYYFSMDTPRAVSYEDILQYDSSYIPCPSLRTTIEMLCTDNIKGDILLCGSFYFIGYFFKEFPEYYRFRIKK